MFSVNFRSLGLVKPNKAKNSLSKASSGDGDCPGKGSNELVILESNNKVGNREQQKAEYHPHPKILAFLLLYQKGFR